MRKSTILAAILSLVALTGCNQEESIKDRNLIVISHHYPSYLNCGYLLETAINNIPSAGFEDTIAVEKEGNVSCADYGRSDDNNTAANFKHLCYTHDYGDQDSNRTCVVGTNFNQYAVGLIDLIIDKADQTQEESAD